MDVDVSWMNGLDGHLWGPCRLLGDHLISFLRVENILSLDAPDLQLVQLLQIYISFMYIQRRPPI